ncbi:MAG: hypothetical protein ACRELB_26445 [Polyangiaceae bacterium]
MTPRHPLIRLFSIVTVSLYLAGVLALLLLTRRIRVKMRGLVRVARASVRPRYSGVLAGIRPETGHCFLAPLPAEMISDADGGSRLVVLEDGKPLPRGHALHNDIRERGEGRYSHHGPSLFFASSDNSDPTTNGRTYSVREE